MLLWYARLLPYSLVVWLCRRHSERFHYGAMMLAEPFKGEIVGWLPAPTTGDHHEP